MDEQGELYSGKNEESRQEEEKINCFEDILELVGTNGRRNYLIIFGCWLCK